MQQLLKHGHRWYDEGRLFRSLVAMRGAGAIADALGEPDAVAEACFWEGAACHGLGRLRAALAAFQRAATSGPLERGAVYMAATRIPRVLVELPAPLAEIDACLHDVETRVARSGCLERRSRLLLVRARLALSRGRFRSALELSWHSLSLREGERHAGTACSHYWIAVLAAIWLDEIELAREGLDEWERSEGNAPCIQTAWTAILRSLPARRRGRVAEALQHARSAWAQARRREDRQERLAAGSALARALLLAGDVEGARSLIGRLRTFRHAEVGEHAFAFWVMRADLHLVRARSLAGLARIEPEFGIEDETSRGRPNRSGARRALVRAERGYESARTLALELDRRLRCSLRAWQLACRTALLERTRGELL
jgi:tetratricopeptide (TPR) repeat protein